jgi:hypothetical protein
MKETIYSHINMGLAKFEMWPLGPIATATSAMSVDGQHAVRPSTSGLLLFWIMLLLFSQHFRTVSGNETAIQPNAGKKVCFSTFFYYIYIDGSFFVML